MGKSINGDGPVLDRSTGADEAQRKGNDGRWSHVTFLELSDNGVCFSVVEHHAVCHSKNLVVISFGAQSDIQDDKAGAGVEGERIRGRVLEKRDGVSHEAKGIISGKNRRVEGRQVLCEARDKGDVRVF